MYHWLLVSVVLPWLLPFGVFATKATVERENMALIGAMHGYFFDNINPAGGRGDGEGRVTAARRSPSGVGLDDS